jgi:ABC-type transport system involved in multi-copper enzyme maturation permease subunit
MRARSDGLWRNPIAVLAAQRWERSRGFVGWVLVPALLVVPAAIIFAQRPPWLTPVLKALLMGRLESPGAGESFALPILLIAFPILTVIGTVPRATLGIAREREQRTLEPLLLTMLSPADILWGELAQVLMMPVLATLALLPLLCFSFWMGSIGIGEIVAGEVALLICHLLFASASLCASCWCRRSGVAMVLGYGWILLLCGATLALWRLTATLVSGWAEAVLTLNPIALLVNAVMPDRGIIAGDFTLPFALVGGAAYAAMSLLFFHLGVLGLKRR